MLRPYSNHGASLTAVSCRVVQHELSTSASPSDMHRTAISARHEDGFYSTGHMLTDASTRPNRNSTSSHGILSNTQRAHRKTRKSAVQHGRSSSTPGAVCFYHVVLSNRQRRAGPWVSLANLHSCALAIKRGSDQVIRCGGARVESLREPGHLFLLQSQTPPVVRTKRERERERVMYKAKDSSNDSSLTARLMSQHRKVWRGVVL